MLSFVIAKLLHLNKLAFCRKGSERLLNLFLIEFTWNLSYAVEIIINIGSKLDKLKQAKRSFLNGHLGLILYFDSDMVNINSDVKIWKGPYQIPLSYGLVDF